jgi:hypothetical protein
MVRSVFFLAAQDIHSGPSLNDCSVQRILEAIPVPAFPAQLDALPLVCLLKRDPTDAAQSTCRLTLTVDQVVLAQCSFDVDFGQSLQHRFTLHLTAITLPKPGTLQLQLDVLDHPVANYEIALVQQDRPIR